MGQHNVNIDSSAMPPSPSPFKNEGQLQVQSEHLLSFNVSETFYLRPPPMLQSVTNS